MLTRVRRRGFTLAEVLTAFALIAVLAAVVVPAVKSRVQDGYEDAIIQEFQSLASGVVAYRQDVGHYPLTLNYLMYLPNPHTDWCGNPLVATDSAKWNGPYISRVFVTTASTYIIAQHDIVNTALNKFNGTNLFYISITNVDTTTAHNIDLKIDGAADPNTGTLRYTPNGATAAVNYVIPSRTGAC